MNTFTIWVYLLTVILVLNFVLAVFLKDFLKITFRENQWLKYVFAIPPFAITTWLLIVTVFIFSKIWKSIVNYFIN